MLYSSYVTNNMKHQSRAIARELIAQQSNDLADQLTELYSEILACKSRREAQESPACKGIVDLLQKRIGIKIDLILATDNPPACMPLMANTRHILSTVMIDDAYNSQTEDFIKAIKHSPIKKGTVDLRNGKLGGVYSQIACPVWMGFNFCKMTFTARECAAVLMHEIGHLFLAFEMMYRTLRASQILAALHQVRTGRDDTITYEHALELAGKDLTGNPREFVECVTMKDNTAISSVVFTRVYHQLATDFGDNAVAGVNFEALSDNFAAKWGLAADLTTGLHKLYGSTSIGRVNGLTSFLMYMAPLIGVFILPAYAVVLTGSIVATIVAGLISVALAVVFGGRSDNYVQQTNVYDKPYVRFQRIRESVVAQLKYLDLDNVNRERLLKELKIIDSYIKGGKEMSNIFEDLSKILTSNRRADFAFKLERDIEQLAHNDLFVNAQRLALKA